MYSSISNAIFRYFFLFIGQYHTYGKRRIFNSLFSPYVHIHVYVYRVNVDITDWFSITNRLADPYIDSAQLLLNWLIIFFFLLLRLLSSLINLSIHRLIVNISTCSSFVTWDCFIYYTSLKITLTCVMSSCHLHSSFSPLD